MKFARTVHHFDTNCLECLHCGDLTELYRNTGSDPQKLLEVRESYEARHSSDAACFKYQNDNAPHDMERETICPRPAALDARAVAMHVLGTKSFA